MIIYIGSSPENYSISSCQCSDIIRHGARKDRFYRNYNSITAIVVLTGNYKLSECQTASLKNDFLFV